MLRSTLPSRRQKHSVVSSRRFQLQLEHLEHRWCPAVPAFSSMPGANHTIYLDFDGHVSTGTQWNSYFGVSSINSPAYDTDGNTSAYSASELADIENAWNRIAEDYIPFNVNVTTVDPGIEGLRKSGTGDNQWGIRVIITRDTQGTGAGGVGYIDSFNWSTDTGVFVYVTGGKNVAEAASHEVGHSLGLAHDGTASAGYYSGHGSGETSWAPLMGVGYYTNVTTWDKGEYYGTNNGGTGANYNKGPDDLAIITSYNGFGYRADDVGNTTASAAPLAVSGTSVSGSGIITTTSDVDYFSFVTGAGQVSLNINPFNPGPNLDIKADLYDASGSLIASSNSATTLSASFSQTLAAGQYYLKIDGTGFGTPGANPPSGYSEYASLGRYFVSGTIVDAGQTAQLSVNSVTVNEAAGTATFVVTLTGSTSSNVTVNYATSNGTAVAPGDYSSTSGTLTFTPGGSTTQSVSVAIVDDTTTESSETFALNLSNASGAVISNGQGVGTITDNDITPTLSIAMADANKAEGTGTAATPFTFTVTRTGSSAGTASVNWTVTGTGTAASANDFASGVLPSGSVSFAAGETSKTITVNVAADSTKEKNEKFRVTLSSPANATIAVATADGTIVNDDGSRPGRGILPHLFPLPGHENDDEYTHEHDDHDDEVVTPGMVLKQKNQNMRDILAVLAPRIKEAFANVSSIAASQITSTSYTSAVSQLQRPESPAETKVTLNTIKALLTGLSNTDARVRTSVTDQLFTKLATNLS